MTEYEGHFILTHITPSGLVYFNSLDRSISNSRGVLLVFFFFFFFFFSFLDIPISGSNSIDHDQTPRSTVSDLGLHCLPITFSRFYYYSLEIPCI